jgi:short-subunit dehydrogenase
MTDAPTIFITGATDGLGHALARRLANDGANLIVHGRDPAKLDRVADEISAAPAGRPEIVVADLAELAQVKRLAQRVGEITGRLDVLVNNAGIGSGGRPNAPGRQSLNCQYQGVELRDGGDDVGIVRLKAPGEADVLHRRNKHETLRSNGFSEEDQ